MPPRQQQPAPQYLDEDHQRIVEFADAYFTDDPEEHATFVDTLMERRGYQRTTGWAPPAEPPSGGGGQQAGPRKPSYFKPR